MRKLTIGLVSLLALGLVACGGGDGATAGTGGSGGGGATGASGAAGGDCVDFTGGPATITIHDFAFDPSCLTVSASESLTFVNQDTSAHKFVLQGGGVEVAIEGETTSKVKSLSNIEPGVYTFNCAFHPSMTGTMTVE
jgi:plastocyanin